MVSKQNWGLNKKIQVSVGEIQYRNDEGMWFWQCEWDTDQPLDVVKSTLKSAMSQIRRAGYICTEPYWDYDYATFFINKRK